MKKKAGLFKKLSIWFWTKKRTISELNKMHNVINAQYNRWLNKIEELEQNKVYLIQVPGASNDEMSHLNDIITEIKLRMIWTPPEILIINREVEAMDEEKVKKLLKHIKNNKRSVKS